MFAQKLYLTEFDTKDWYAANEFRKSVKDTVRITVNGIEGVDQTIHMEILVLTRFAFIAWLFEKLGQARIRDLEKMH